MSEELIRTVAANPDDQVAWGKLYNPTVYYAAFRACRGASDLARELVQGAFERLLRFADLNSFHSDAQLAAYLRQTVRRLAFDELRRLAVMTPLETDAVAASDADALLADLERLAKDLHEGDRELLGKLLLGHTLTEIAEKMGISYSSAAVRIHRLRNKLARKTNT